MNCLVDGDGIVLDAWIGHSEERAATAMGKAGIDVTTSDR